MTSTTSAYLAVSQNLPRYQAMTAAEPAVKSATAYYEANIGSVTSIQDFVGNYRLLSYALDAYGLGDQINATALITKVLEGGVSNPKSLANTLSNSAWKAFAAAFNFAGGRRVLAFVVERGPDDDERLCRTAARERPGRAGRRRRACALFPARGADRHQRIRNSRRSQSPASRPDDLGALAVDQRGEHQQQAQTLSQLMPISDLQDPAKLQQLTERFTAMYDLTYGPGSGATTNLDGRLEQFDVRPVGRRRGARRRHQLERLGAEQRAQRLHRRADASVFDRPVVEPAEIFARRLNARRPRTRRKARASAAP